MTKFEITARASRYNRTTHIAVPADMQRPLDDTQKAIWVRLMQAVTRLVRDDYKLVRDKTEDRHQVELMSDLLSMTHTMTASYWSHAAFDVHEATQGHWLATDINHIAPWSE